jgi:hypothetical protein
MAIADWSETASYMADKTITSPYAGWGDFHCVHFTDYAKLYELAWNDPDVAVLFAHVPVFMVPDDHDVTDDWNITGGWVPQALGDKDWATTLSAGVLAYWLYQGWGNVSRTAAEAHPILAFLETNTRGKDMLQPLRNAVDAQLRRVMHAPVYFTIPTSPPIIAMDARTDRQFVAPKPKKVSGGGSVIVYTDRDDQILSDTQFQWLERQLAISETPIVLSSVPLLQTPPGDRLLRFATRPTPDNDFVRNSQRQSNGFEAMVREQDAETWFAFPKSVDRLLQFLATRREVFFLAGDVHYTYVYDVRGYTYLDTQGKAQKAKTRLVHAVSSALQNEWGVAQIEGLKELGARMPRDPQTGQPVAKMGVPATDPVRDQFDVPENVWATAWQLLPALRERFVDKRYCTINNIGVVDLRARIMTWLGHVPGPPEPNRDPLIELARLKL